MKILKNKKLYNLKSQNGRKLSKSSNRSTSKRVYKPSARKVVNVQKADMVLKNEIIKSADVKVYFDSDMGKFIFYNNLTRVESEDDVFMYVDNGNITDEVDYTILPRQKTKLKKVVREECDCSYSEVKDLDEDDLINILSDNYGSDFNVYEICKAHDIKTARGNYTEIEVIGYSQGDFATVLVDVEALKKCWGCEVDLTELKDSLTNYFYDAPISCKIDILGTEYISEQFDNRYQNYQAKDLYDKSEFIKELVNFFKDEVNNLDYFRDQLEELLPADSDNLEYIG